MHIWIHIYVSVYIYVCIRVYICIYIVSTKLVKIFSSGKKHPAEDRHNSVVLFTAFPSREREEVFLAPSCSLLEPGGQRGPAHTC